MSDQPQPGPLAGNQPQTPLDLSAYRGCWVAIVGGQVAGVGTTFDAAQLAARHSRPRERIGAILWVPNDP